MNVTIDLFSPLGHHFLNLHTDLCRNDEAQTCSRADVATARSTRSTRQQAKVANYGTTHLRCAVAEIQIHSRTWDISALPNCVTWFSHGFSLLPLWFFGGLLDVISSAFAYIRKVRISTYSCLSPHRTSPILSPFYCHNKYSVFPPPPQKKKRTMV